MTRFVATFRAAFEAETEGVAQVTSERCLESLEGILGEEDEADEPSYDLQLTEVVPFAAGTTDFVELADQCLLLRNQLIATKRMPCVHQGLQLDELAWQLRRALEPDMTPYDRARHWEVCQAVWSGKNPTD